METNTHYLKIGIFVLVFTSLLIIGLLWLSVGFNSQSYKLYEVYMKESVSGLSIKAPVKYNGVDVGYVATIKLAPENPQNVALLLAVEDDVPIYQGTHAQLQTQGLTGISFINLRGGNARLHLIKIQDGEKYPEIPSAPSLFMRLDTAVDSLTRNLNTITSRVNHMLNQKNVDAINDIVQNIDMMSKVLGKNSNNVDMILKQTALATKQFPQVMNTVAQTATELDTASKTAVQTLSASKALVQNVNNQVLPQMTQTLNSAQSAADNLSGLASEVQQNPSMLLRGKQPAAKGPGE